MKMTRREMMACSAIALPALRTSGLAHAADQKKWLGVVTHSYSIRVAADRAGMDTAGFADPLVFIEHCHKLGAGGVQLGIGPRDPASLASLREKLAAHEMFLEGIIRLPRDRKDADRFADEVRVARAAGAKVLRTVMLNGRRYETFDSADTFRKAGERARQALALAEPIVARHDIRLAVENHKDWRVDELVDILKRLDSRHVGACVDTGNSIALLEDPLEVVEALAPWAFTTHLKDMGVAEYEEGFLLSEVPLGEGILDLKKIVGLLRRARPESQLNLEMITRDPLKVPCLTPKYWATLDNLPAKHLARMLTWVRQHKLSQPLPRITGLTPKEQLTVEEGNVQKSLAYARKHLEL